MDEKWVGLLKSRKVWLALLGVAVALARWARVEIPDEVLASVEMLIGVVIVGIAVEDHGLRSSGR